ncbi:hypothetical protein EDD18DRAFT_1113385 [Armillaria luteobubalina]|uniref:Uncharacterized protein n=1 Tax=Armillaria luteobubalina TaxID=153913 RepID=A0AA39PB71_9AGAR|nr:hypothetical protein EDD18DRAFT_1113385 [Armillaria luteobubalina]
MSFTTPSKSSSQIPSSPLAKVKLPHRLSLSNGNYDAASLKAQNIQLSYFHTHQVVVSFNPENQSLMLYEYPAYSDANRVSRPILAEDLAQVWASNINIVFPSCWCLAAFTGEYCKTIIFMMSPLTNAKYENPGKLALHCSQSSGSSVPIQQLTSQGALRNPLRIPAPGRTKSASSLLHALDKSFVGSSKCKFAVEPDSSPKKSQVLAPDSDTDFSPPLPSVLGSKKAVTQDTMFKAAFLQKGSLRGTSTIEEFFQGTATFSHPSLHALEEAYMSGRGISLQNFHEASSQQASLLRGIPDQTSLHAHPQNGEGKGKISFMSISPPESYPQYDDIQSTHILRSESHYATYQFRFEPTVSFLSYMAITFAEPRHFNAMYCTLENLWQDGSRIVVPIFSLLLQLFFILMGKVQGPITGGGSHCFLGCPSPRNWVDLCKDPNVTPENPTPIADSSTLQDGHPDTVNEMGHTLLVPQNEIDTLGGKKRSMHTEVVRAFKKLTRIGARWCIDGVIIPSCWYPGDICRCVLFVVCPCIKRPKKEQNRPGVNGMMVLPVGSNDQKKKKKKGKKGGPPSQDIQVNLIVDLTNVATTPRGSS